MHNPMRFSQNRPPPMFSTYIVSAEKLQSNNKFNLINKFKLNKFNQRTEKMQKERKIVKKKNGPQSLNEVKDFQFFMKDYR